MTNPMFSPQPNYSGVTIQIANPAVNVCQNDGKNVPCVSNGCYGVYPNSLPNPQGNYVTSPQAVNTLPGVNQYALTADSASNPNQNTGYPNAYPAQYYLNNYNYPVNADRTNLAEQNKATDMYGNPNYQTTGIHAEDNVVPNSYKIYAQKTEQKDNDMTKSENIKEDLAQREAEIENEKKNTKETKIVALTDEYIKSLENYLNNPNDEIRLMASKEILTRLDEDKERYDDAALNALLNKMMQDPNKLVRIAALSAFSSQLASGNDYTVQLLHNIQSNSNSDKEDVLQAADILLKMSAGTEIKNIPNPSVKDKKE